MIKQIEEKKRETSFMKIQRGFLYLLLLCIALINSTHI